MRSSWPHPSFGGNFLPAQRGVDDKGFDATYRIGNLALGQSLVTTGDAGSANIASASPPPSRNDDRCPIGRRRRAPQTAQVSLVQPVDLYSQVNRSTKYGFLFIGFTFLAFLLFDVIGGVRVSAVEYLLVGAAWCCSSCCCSPSPR